jgi:GAF domain-containing protein
VSNVSDLRPATVAELLVPALVAENQRLQEEVNRLHGWNKRHEIALRNFLAQYFGKFAEQMLEEIGHST